MKKQPLLTGISILFAFLFTSNVRAQNLPVDDSSVTAGMNQIFSLLDKSKVPTGLLLDYGIDFTNLAAYNGTTLADTTRNTPETVMNIYNTLASSLVYGNPGGFQHPLYVDSLWQVQRTAGQITLCGLYYQYAQLNPNAVANGTLTVTNNQPQDVYIGGVWQNPYLVKQVVCMSPSINYYNSDGTYSVNVLLPTGLFLTNSVGAVSSINCDFGDGRGARTVTPGVAIPISYSSGGTKTWNFTYTLAAGGTLQSQNYFALDSTSGGIASITRMRSGGGVCSAVRFKGFKKLMYGNPNQIVIPNVQPYYGQTAGGTMTIWYSNSDMKIHNPLIIAEGYDVGDVLTPEQVHGFYDYNEFITTLQNVPVISGSSIPNLASEILSGQYDLIYIDWNHSGDFIERNAQVLEAAINWVNGNRATGQPIILVGQSMGALVSRWALKDMENHGVNHQVRMFVSWDGPHQGANIPIAYQYASRQALSLYFKANGPLLFNVYNNFIVPSANNFILMANLYRAQYGGSPWSYLSQTNLPTLIMGALTLQDNPSVREMLINYINPSGNLDNSIHSAWQSSYQGMGYPTHLMNVAVSNGSECGMPEPFNPGQAMLDIRGNASPSFFSDMLGLSSLANGIISFLFRDPVQFGLGLLPGGSQYNAQFTCNAQPNQTTAQQYVGKLSYSKNFFWGGSITHNLTNWTFNSNPSILPYDFFPGGAFPNTVNLNNTQFSNFLVKFNLSVLSDQPSFCGVPTPSALDIGSGAVSLGYGDYDRAYSGAIPLNTPYTSPFFSWTTGISESPNMNEPHIEINNHNGNWVAEQINGQIFTNNCISFCGGMNISGPTTVCSADQTYSVQSISGASYNWGPPYYFQNPQYTITSGGSSPTANVAFNSTDVEQLIQCTIGTPTCGIYTPVLAIEPGLAPTPVTCSQLGNGTCQIVTPICPSGFFQPYGYAIPVPNWPGISGWSWQVSGGVFSNGSTSETTILSVPQITATATGNSGSVSVTVQPIDNCGVVHNQYPPLVFVNISTQSACTPHGMFKVSPSPATTTLSISPSTIADGSGSDAVIGTADNAQSTSVGKTNSIDGATDNSLAEGSFTLIEMFDLTGRKVKHLEFAPGTQNARVDVSNLVPGIYIVRLLNGTKWEQHMIRKDSN